MALVTLGDLSVSFIWKPKTLLTISVLFLVVFGPDFSTAQNINTEAQGAEAMIPVEHPDCTYFGPKHERFAAGARNGGSMHPGRGQYSLSALTEQVAQAVTFIPGGSRTDGFEKTHQSGSIDNYLYADMQAAGVKPADKTTDFEFIRRVTLDLTGRIPVPERVLRFAADSAADKRSKLIEELVNKPEWVDKWAMYFGDLYNNNVRNTQVVRYTEGRNAFYKWIRDSLAANKPYNQMASEIIAARGTNSYLPEQGHINWLVGGIVTGGPQQDIWDQQAANVAETFLGISHMNCVLCHNGRGHLDALSLWGKNTTRSEAWGLAAFLSHSYEFRTPPASMVQNYAYWSIDDDTRYRTDYALNTTTGNRPARQPIGAQRTMAPVYPFSGNRPAAGENYRSALARQVTSDFQFARATVNYIWKEFFSRGLVEPTNQFDPARLDPDNPPPDPWTLQPSNPRLLNALAQRFIDGGFDLKALMHEITNSEAYQLSSVYNGEWNPAWEKLFARKFVRRLWAEEIHDAIAQSSNILPSYSIPGFSTKPLYSDLSFGPIQWAMKFPDVNGMPDNGAVSRFLDSFLRGNRDDEDRRSDGSPIQALGLMNDNFIMSRIHATGAGTANGLLARSLSLPDDQMIDTLYLTVLSRHPSDPEMKIALAHIKSAARTPRAENLLWSLYNKVDFIFNY